MAWAHSSSAFSGTAPDPDHAGGPARPPEYPPFYQQGAGNFWVAVLDNKVVGTVALLDLGNHQAALRKMFVHAAYRGPGHGVSARLLETLLKWARSRGVEEVYLGTTEKFLAAHRFYERNGFQQIAATELPPTFPKMAVDTGSIVARRSNGMPSIGFRCDTEAYVHRLSIFIAQRVAY